MCVCVCVSGGGREFTLISSYSGTQTEGNLASKVTLALEGHSGLPRSCTSVVWKGGNSTEDTCGKLMVKPGSGTHHLHSPLVNTLSDGHT